MAAKPALALALLLALIALSATLAAARPPSGLYGLSSSTALVRIDPKTGAITQIGSPIPYEAIAQELATIDPIDCIYYFLGYNLTSQLNAIIGLNMTDGSLVVETRLPFVAGAFIGVGEVLDYDRINRKLIVMGRETTRPPAVHHVLALDPFTGHYRDLARIGDIDVLGGGNGFDPSAGIEWVSLGVNKSTGVEIDLFGIDVTNGHVQHQVSNTANVNTFTFDHTTGKMLCFGYDNGARTVVSLNSRDGSLKVIGTVPNFTIIDGSISALDFKNRILYAILQPTSGGSFSLVGVNPDTAAVISSTPFCTDITLCPWAVEYLP